jgi:hypothetical protein
VVKNASVQEPLSMEPAALSFVIPSEGEGSAVPRTLPGNVFERAWWRDLRFPSRSG